MQRALTPFFFLTVVLAALSAQAGQTSTPTFNISTDRNTLVQGEPFELKITISTQSKNDPVIRLPALAGFRVISQSEYHPRSFSFSFGFGTGGKSYKESKQQSIYTFVVVADRPGKYTINPIEVKVDGKAFKSTPYHLNVAAGGAASGSSPPSAQQQSGSEPSNQETIDGAIVDPDYFIQLKSSSSDNTCTVGERIILTVYLYTSRNLGSAQVVREPGTEGFWVETIETGGRQGMAHDQVRIGDTSYERVILRKLALFPIKSGELEIAPVVTELEVGGGGFFSRRKTVKRSSSPLKIIVKPLPTEGQPHDFDHSNVGVFNYRVSIDHAEVKVGEPVTVVMMVKGSGNMRNLSLPELKELDGFKVYAPETEVEVQARGNDVTGVRTSRTLLIPKEPGNFNIPDLVWTYFNPQLGKYVTVHGGVKKITVKPGVGLHNVESGGRDDGDAPAMDGSKRLNQQLRTIHSRAVLRVDDGDLPMESAWFIVLVLLLPLGYLTFIIVVRARLKMKQGNLKGRSKNAGAAAGRALNALSRDGDAISSEQFFARLQKIIVSFLEDKLEAPVAGDTMSELDIRLADRGIDKELAARTVAELEACDFARFAKSAGDNDERSEALNRVRDLISTLGAAVITPVPEEADR